MPQEKVDALRAVYAAWERGNFEAGADLLDQQVVFILRPGFPDEGTYLGTEGLEGYMRGFLAAWTDLTIAGEEFIEAGDTVVVAAHQRGVGRDSGIPVDLRYFQLWTFRGDTVIRLEGVRDRAEALEAVGLRK